MPVSIEHRKLVLGLPYIVKVIFTVIEKKGVVGHRQIVGQCSTVIWIFNFLFCNPEGGIIKRRITTDITFQKKFYLQLQRPSEVKGKFQLLNKIGSPWSCTCKREDSMVANIIWILQ